MMVDYIIYIQLICLLFTLVYQLNINPGKNQLVVDIVTKQKMNQAPKLTNTEKNEKRTKNHRSKRSFCAF
jgi:hypothetical protein